MLLKWQLFAFIGYIDNLNTETQLYSWLKKYNENLYPSLFIILCQEAIVFCVLNFLYLLERVICDEFDYKEYVWPYILSFVQCSNVYHHLPYCKSIKIGTISNFFTIIPTATVDTSLPVSLFAKKFFPFDDPRLPTKQNHGSHIQRGHKYISDAIFVSVRQRHH